MVTLMPTAMQNMTASTEARTLVAPLMPQNQGVGCRSTTSTKPRPVGKAKPRRNPNGMMTAREIPIRTRRSCPVVDSRSAGKAQTIPARYTATILPHRSSLRRAFNLRRSELKLPRPEARIRFTTRTASRFPPCSAAPAPFHCVNAPRSINSTTWLTASAKGWMQRPCCY